MLDGYQIFDADAHTMMSPNMWADRHSMVLVFAHPFMPFSGSVYSSSISG